MINIRKSVQENGNLSSLDRQLGELTEFVVGHCEQESCEASAIDSSLVNHQFLSMALDLRSTLDVSRVLSSYEIKATYQYMMLLYLDLIIVEQKLIEAQYDVLAKSMLEVEEELDANPMISQAEKEYLYQLATNIAARWVKNRDERRLTLGTALRAPLLRLQGENDQLQDELDLYRPKSLSNKDNYQDQLNDMLGELQEFGMQMNVFDQNPFQTGTALQNYYLGEKTLLLERDTYFQLKSNKLETTDQVADYHHRLKVLQAHGHNIIIQLFKAFKEQIENPTSVGEIAEQGKTEEAIEQIIENCNRDAQCVAERLANPETHLSNILLDNLRLTGSLFEQIPHMQALEVQSIYQLSQLIFLEVLYGRMRVSRVEFDLFYKKQMALKKSIETNRNLSPLEKKLHTETVRNTLNKWKLQIAQRKFDGVKEFSLKAQDVAGKNSKILKEVEVIRSQAAVDVRSPECKTTIFNPDRQRCLLRNKLESSLKKTLIGESVFLNKIEQVLPLSFWEKI
jgi:hypothetical protein